MLFDRDGTLVPDLPDNRDPDLVRPQPEALRAVRLLRAGHVPIGVVTNQPGLARGVLSRSDVRRINDRIEELLGRFDVWAVCPHARRDGCPCRAPGPGLILRAAARLGVPARECLVVGHTRAELYAARAAGARGVMVRPGGPAAAPPDVGGGAAPGGDAVAPNVYAAVRRALYPSG